MWAAFLYRACKAGFFYGGFSEASEVLDEYPHPPGPFFMGPVVVDTIHPPRKILCKNRLGFTPITPKTPIFSPKQLKKGKPRMTKDSSTVSVRLKNDDIKRLKASGCTASQVFRQFLDRGFTPAEPEVDLTAFLRACERRRRKPQEVIDMITEQILEV